MGTSIVAKPKYPQAANNKNTKSLDYDMGGCHEDNYCSKSREYGEEDEAEPIQNHSCKLPVSFNSRSLVIFAHLVSHNLDLLEDEPELPMDSCGVDGSLGIFVAWQAWRGRFDGDPGHFCNKVDVASLRRSRKVPCRATSSKVVFHIKSSREHRLRSDLLGFQ